MKQERARVATLQEEREQLEVEGADRGRPEEGRWEAEAQSIVSYGK